MFLKNPIFSIFSPTHCMYRAIPGSDYSPPKRKFAAENLSWHWLESEETEVTLRDEAGRWLILIMFSKQVDFFNVNIDFAATGSIKCTGRTALRYNENRLGIVAI